MYVNYNHHHEKQQSWSSVHSTLIKVVIIENAVIDSFTGSSIFVDFLPFVRAKWYRTKEFWIS